ncbi:MAG: alpha/beta fold hydrolase [Blastocatellia bacterium]|nr:alpha/beta fold hydrolase [Blastocatellia bacterium]
MTDLTGNIFFEGPVGRIEAILKEPASAPVGVAIVCHPHPLFGGTMHNKVVYRIAKAFHQSGFAVLRFNFRGTGRSQGNYDKGRGEQDDLSAAIRFMEEKYPGAEVWLAGFSFGARVLLEAVCEDDKRESFRKLRALIAAGTPVSRYDFESAISCPVPKLFVQGAGDEFGSVADLEKLLERMSGPKSLKVIEGADHFFEGRLDELAQAVSEFISSADEERGSGMRNAD